MMKNFCILSGGLVSAMILMGCRGERKQVNNVASSKQKNEGNAATALTISQMKPDDVVVAVNGAPLTKKRLNQQLEGIKRSLQKEQRNSDNPYLVQQRLKDEALQVIPRFIERELLLQDAVGKRVMPQAEAERQVDEKLAQLAQKSKMPVEAMFRQSPFTFQEIRSNFVQVVYIQALVASNIPPSITVDEKFVQSTIDTIRAENNVVIATNQAKAVRLKEVRARVLAGKEDFDKMALKISESDDLQSGRGGYWGEFSRNEIQDKNMRATIFDLGTNDVSNVVEDEEGYRLLKVVSITPVKTNETGVVLQPERRSVSQILLKKDPLILEVSREKLTEELKQQMQSRAITSYVDVLRSKATILYPNGTNFWGKATSSTDKPMMKAK